MDFHTAVPSECIPLDDVLTQLIVNTEVIQDHADHAPAMPTGLSTGFRDLDAITGGFCPGELIVLAGRPRMGRTTFVVNLAEHIGTRSADGPSVLLFSPNASRLRIANKMLCAGGYIDSLRLARGSLGDNEWEQIANRLRQFHKKPIFVDDSVATIDTLAERALAWSQSMRPGLLVVDMLPMLVGARTARDRAAEMSAIGRELKLLGRTLSVPVVATTSISSSVDTRRDPRPSVADLSDVGVLADIADLVLLLYREEIYAPSPLNVGVVEVIVGKHARGPTGTIRLAFAAGSGGLLDTPTDKKVLPETLSASAKPVNHGKAWSVADDAHVLALWKSADAPSASIIATVLGRAEGSIVARLVHLGLFPDREAARAADLMRAR